MNLSALSGAEGAFINNFKNCGALTPTVGSNFPPILNDNGYPASPPPTTLRCNIPAMPQVDNPEWIVGWFGTLTIKLNGPRGNVTIINDSNACVLDNANYGALTLGGSNCVVRFRFPSPPSGLEIQFPATGSYVNPSNAYMVRADEAGLHAAGAIIRPVTAGMLASKLSDLGIKVVRFLGWNAIADKNSTSRFDALNRTTAFSWFSTRWYGPSFPGSTGSSVSAKPISGADTYEGAATTGSTIDYIDGQIYQNIVTNANSTSAPTLRLCDQSGKCGADVTIVSIDGGALATSGSGSTRISAGQLATFVYNAKLNRWLYNPGGMSSRVPPEVMISLCNELGVDCWIQIPQLFDDQSVGQLVKLVRDTLDSRLTAYFEYSNELFNVTASPFHIAYKVGNARGFPDQGQHNKNEYALKFRQMMGVVSDAWSPRSMSSLVRVMPWAIYETPSPLLIISGSRLTLDGSGYYCNGSGCTIVTRYDRAGSCSATNNSSGRPVDCVDAFAYAPYYNGAQLASGDSSYDNDMREALQAADDYASGDSVRMSAALEFVDCDVRGTPTAAHPNCGRQNGQLGGRSKVTLANYNKAGSTYEKYNALATTWEKTVIGYEGGYQAVPPTAARLAALASAGGYSTCRGGDAAACSSAFSSLIAAYKNDDRFARLVYDQMMQFKLYSRSTIPAWLVLGPSGGQWAVYGGRGLDTPPWKSYEGLKMFTIGR